MVLYTTQILCGSEPARDARNSVALPAPVRRPVAHPVNAFISESWVKASPIRIAPTAGKRPVGQCQCFIARTAHLTTTMVILMSSATRRFAATPPVRLVLPVLR